MKYCGALNNHTRQISGGILNIEFHSDWTRNADGFEMTWEATIPQYACPNADRPELVTRYGAQGIAVNTVVYQSCNSNLGAYGTDNNFWKRCEVSKSWSRGDLECTSIYHHWIHVNN